MAQKKKALANDKEFALARAELMDARDRKAPHALREVAVRYPQQAAALVDLSLGLAATTPNGPLDASPELDALATRAQERAFAAVFPVAASLKALRQARGLSMAQVAGSLRLGVDVLSALEAGRIRAQSVPNRLLGRLGELLDQSAVQIGAVLGAQPALAAAYQRSTSGKRKGATQPAQLDFVEAVKASPQTPDDAKADWLTEG